MPADAGVLRTPRSQPSMTPRRTQRAPGGGIVAPSPSRLVTTSSPWPAPSEEWSLPQKSLGQFSELHAGYASYRPARTAVRNALDSGMIRDPLKMQQQRTVTWSAKLDASDFASNHQVSKPASRPASRAFSSPTPRGNTDGDWGMQPTGGLPRIDGGSEFHTVMQPQRIELPSYLNTPTRRTAGTPLPPEEKAVLTRRIQDLDLLVYACRRASKAREEGRAHFALGVMYDNIGQYKKGIECYESFLKICKQSNDRLGTALAYHCIGVNYQLIGMGVGTLASAAPRDDMTSARSQGDVADADNALALTSSIEEPTSPRKEVKPDMLRKAIEFHNKHRELTDDVGKFVAHLNMGLAYSSLGESESSVMNHQYALRHAMSLRSLEGESLAIGGLGFSPGLHGHDPERMKFLVERYMQICGHLKRTKHKAHAFSKLGVIASREGDNDQGVRFFKQALAKAKESGSRTLEAESSVHLGIASAQARMTEHLSHVLDKCMSRVAPDRHGDDNDEDDDEEEE